MSSPPPGTIPSFDEVASPYLDVSLEDLDDWWPLLDDQENLVITQPEYGNIELCHSDRSPHFQAAYSDNSSMLPRETGGAGTPVPTMTHNSTSGQMLEQQDKFQSSDHPAGIIERGLLFTDTHVEDVLWGEENAGFPTTSRAEKRKGLKAVDKIKIRSPNNAEAEQQVSRKTRTGRVAVQTDGEECSMANKKHNHNAKERVRRMKLNESYSALGALLPQSRRSTKRWSAAMIIDKMVEYIPELKKEIEDLTLKKERMLDQRQEVFGDNKICRTSETTPSGTEDRFECFPITVSVHEVKSGEELILQICKKKKKRKEGEEYDSVFSMLIYNLEDEGLSVSSTSTLDIGEDQVCYQLHAQMNESAEEADRAATLQGKIISWLRLTGPSSSRDSTN